MSGVKKWEDRMPAPRWVKRCDMNCSPRTNDCDDCDTVRVRGDAIAARDAEIAEYRAIQAAPEATSEQMGGAQVAKADNFDPVAMLLLCVSHTDCENMVGIEQVLNYLRQTATTLSAAEGEATERKPLTGRGDVVCVCPERDIECGRNPRSWCETCPQQHHGITGGAK